MEVIQFIEAIDGTTSMGLAVAVIWMGKNMLEGARLHDQKVIDRLLGAVENLCQDCASEKDKKQ